MDRILEMSRENLIELIQAYREYVSCIIMDCGPHEGCDIADSDFCCSIKNEIESFDGDKEGYRIIAEKRDNCVRNALGKCDPRDFGWIMLSDLL